MTHRTIYHGLETERFRTCKKLPGARAWASRTEGDILHFGGNMRRHMSCRADASPGSQCA